VTLQQAMADATEQLMEASFNDPADINKGGCFEWATLVFADVEGTQIHGHHRYGGGYHVFISYRGRYYDSETPQGITRWQNLPYFKRCRAEDVV
jgi:hypothetical protein